MCEIPEEILEILKCSQCDDYLSSSPVILTTSGDNLCGSCSATSSNAIRNIVYEKLALIALFPCRNKSNGCEKKLTINEIKKHESGCEYQDMECPMTFLQNCSWTGKSTKLKQHFQEVHSDLIVSHPATIPANIHTNNEVWLLMEAYNLLFLVQSKCQMSAAKLWYCVRFIGNCTFASLFEFKLNIGNTSERLIKTKVVQPYTRLLLSKNDVLELNINALLAVVDDTDGKNITGVISVDFKNKNCIICKEDKRSSIIFLNDRGYQCNECHDNLQKITCKYSSSGCTYEDIKMNMPKHEMWFCSYSKSICTLQGCGAKMPELTTLIEHLTSKHITTKMNYYPAASGPLKENVWYGDILEIYGAKFITNTRFMNSQFNYTIVTNLTKFETLKFRCKVKIINLSTHDYIEKELNRDIQSLEYDWSVVIEDTNNKILHQMFDEKGKKVKLFQCQILVEKCNTL